MTSLIIGIGCIVVVLSFMVPPILFGYAICDMDDDLVKFAATLCVIEFVVLTIGLIYCVNGGLFE